MADEIKKKIIIEGDTSDVNSKLDDTTGKLNDLDNELTDVTQSNKQFTDSQKTSVEAVTKNGGAIAILDQITGGMASQFKNAYEATGLFNNSLKGTRGALLATGIGAFIVLLGTVITYWDDIKKAINKSDDALKDLNVTAAETLGLFNLLADTASSAFLFSDLLDAGLSMGILRDEFKELDTAIKQLEKSGTDSAENVQNLVDKYREYLVVQRNIKKITEEIKKVEEEGEDDQAIQMKTLESRLALLFKQKYELGQLFKVEPSGEDKPTGGKSKAEIEAEKEAARLLEFDKEQFITKLEAKEAFEKKLQEVKDRYRQDEIEKQLSAEQIEIANNKNKYDALIRQAEEFGIETQTLKDVQEAEKNKIEIKYADQRRDDRLARQLEEQEKASADFLLDLENVDLSFGEKRELIKARQDEIDSDDTLSKEQRLQYTKEVSQAEMDLADEVRDVKIAAGQVTADALSSFSELAGQQTALGKGLAIAAATINTYQSAVSSYNALAGITIAGPALGALAAAAAVASGIANVKKILSIKVPGQSGGGSAGSAPSMSMPPQFNVVGQSSTNQLAETIGQKQNEPVKAYVVSGDVTSGQQLDRNRIDNSTFL